MASPQRARDKIAYRTDGSVANVLRETNLAQGRVTMRYPGAKTQVTAVPTPTLAGLPIAHSQFLTEAMQVVRSNASKWQAAREKGQTLTVPAIMIEVISQGDTRVSQGKLKVGRDTVLEIEIDLAKVFTEVDRAQGGNK